MDIGDLIGYTGIIRESTLLYIIMKIGWFLICIEVINIEEFGELGGCIVRGQKIELEIFGWLGIGGR